MPHPKPLLPFTQMATGDPWPVPVRLLKCQTELASWMLLMVAGTVRGKETSHCFFIILLSERLNEQKKAETGGGNYSEAESQARTL